ncbi:MAG: hypothetical protein CVU03_05385 [Bacteroidetes bacterium HGW-Bacteroidetes-2]|jgi:OOP family OmpA-OmpF porin|nr:MAG: hypothetical protein CVU03_05385 [Bacteroidetes bacterium HGW-Bacteroidetes-2]
MKMYLLTLLLLTASISFAQNDKFNSFSFEIGYGLHAPLSPGDKTSRSNFVGLGNFEVGARYQITQKLGLKVAYNNNHFEDKNNADSGVDYNRVSVEAVYNLGRHVLPYYIYENVGVLAHAGFGYARAKPLALRSAEQTGNFIFGFRPQVKLSERFALYADGSYIVNFKQHYSFSGILLSPDFQDKTGSFATLSFGVMLYLGDGRRHADWY